MAWQTPKTDWTASYDSTGAYTGDYFEATDYQRIKGNLDYLATQADTLCSTPAALNIPDVTTASFGYASYINALETALDKLLAAGVFDPGIAARKTWAGNAAGPAAADLNRIESSCLALYNVLTQQAACRPKLAINLGLREVG